MSEDEYDALDDDSKAKVDKKRLEIKKERLKKYDLSLVIIDRPSYQVRHCITMTMTSRCIWIVPLCQV